MGEHTAGGANYNPRGPEVALGGSGASFSSSSLSKIAHSTVNAWQLFLSAAEMFSSRKSGCGWQSHLSLLKCLSLLGWLKAFCLYSSLMMPVPGKVARWHCSGVKYGLFLWSCRAATGWRGGLWVLSSEVGQSACECALVFSGIVGLLCKL